MSQEREHSPHPRAAVSGRLSAEEFRALHGRTAPRARTPRGHPASATSALRNTAAVSSGDLTQLPFEAVLPFLPPSINNTQLTVRDEATGALRRALSNKARQARKAIGCFVRGRLAPDVAYELDITVELPALTRAGALRKVDLTNRVKFLEDCISACLGIDDRQFFRVVLTKLHAEHERTVIRIRPFVMPSSEAA